MRIVTVSTSTRKGEKKIPQPQITLIENFGVEGDVHADGTHRQLSLLAMEDIEYMRGIGASVNPGDFAENITTEGIELLSLPLGTIIGVGPEAELELSQIGKVCHTKCAIYQLMGDCIFPREGIFFIVRKSGTVHPGDPITIQKEGDGTCAATPKAALEELAVATR